MPRHYIDELDDQLLYERCESFGGGMDNFDTPTLLPPDVYQYGENILVLDNLNVRTRAGADTLGTTRGGLVQGLIYFTTPSYSQLIAAANQALSYYDGSNWTAINGWTLADASVLVAAAQGVDTILFSDGTSLYSYDGAALTQLIGEVPTTATVLCWHTGRMFASGFPGGASGKEADAIWVSTRLDFSAGKWNKTLRQFRVGGGEGDPIIGLASMQQYVLAVLKQNSIWLVITDPTAEPANFAANQPSEALSYGVGVVGRRAFCQYGNDLLFVARDGVRSLQRMVAATGQYQLSAPLSQPIQPFIDRINWNYAHLINAKKYKELALFSVPLDNSTYPNTVLVWNGRLGKWIGIWSGWTPTIFEVTRQSSLTPNLRAGLVFGDHTGLVRQWKDYATTTDDSTYLEDGAAIASKLWIRSLLFGEPINDKDAYHAELRFTASNALVNVTAVADNAQLDAWQIDARRTGPQLPHQLPIQLVPQTAFAARHGLRGKRTFNEVYLKIESTAGWWQLRNVSLSAFLNTLSNQ